MIRRPLGFIAGLLDVVWVLHNSETHRGALPGMYFAVYHVHIVFCGSGTSNISRDCWRQTETCQLSILLNKHINHTKIDHAQTLSFNEGAFKRLEVGRIVSG